MAEYTIRIINDTGGGGAYPQTAPTPEGNNAASNGKESSTKDIARPIFATVALAKKIVQPMIAQQVNTVSLRTGSEEYQQRQQLIYDVASRGFSVAESVAAGALIGGGVPGAVIGFVAGLGMQGLQLITQTATLQLKQNEESVNISLANIRAGARGSRYQNDT